MAEAKRTETVQNGGIKVPYLNAYGNITKALERIQTASTPDRFTQDFLAAKLNLKGGSATPIIPFLKRTGFLNGDGSPTELYKEFRNSKLRGSAAAKALKNGYAALYDIHEYAHDLEDKELNGIIVQATGLGANSTTAKSVAGSFKALRAFADFDAENNPDKKTVRDEPADDIEKSKVIGKKEKEGSELNLKLGYTINLNLPATSDVAVFNAIFKSLREHLLD